MTPSRPRFSIQVGQQFASWSELVSIYQQADELGYDTAYGYDHFMAVMMDPFDPCLEAWTSLAALASLTKRIRLGILVTGNTYRHPAVLAKTATTVDVISNGRLDFGIGAGWFEPEHQALGIPFRTVRQRCEMLDESLQVIRSLWHERTTSFAGRFFELRDAIGEPKPVQKPHPPILIAGVGEKLMLRIVARHADAWNGFGSPDVFRHKISVLNEHCKAEKRDPAEIEKSVLVPASLSEDPDIQAPLVQGFGAYQGLEPEEARKWMLLGSPSEVEQQIRGFLAVGVTHFILTLTPFNMEVLPRFAAEVMPRFR